MQIATWNVNSLSVRLPQVLAWLAANPVDALCLQELKLTDDKFPHDALKEAGYEAAAFGQKTYNGVAILSRHPLRDVVRKLALAWHMDSGFVAYLSMGCVWVNSLVDRIVPEAIEPAGAVAEPYAVWVIEAQKKMVLPCTHPQIIVTDKLEPYERRKLFLLNLGHTFLAEHWLQYRRSKDETVLQAMSAPKLRAELEA
eukprot:gene49609-66453_t